VLFPLQEMDATDLVSPLFRGTPLFNHEKIIQAPSQLCRCSCDVVPLSAEGWLRLFSKSTPGTLTFAMPTMKKHIRFRCVRTLRCRDGFTLVELLVVFAVLAILLALIFPVFSRAMQSAQSAKCVSNLKQIGVAVNLYCNDHDGLYPRSYGGGSDFYWISLEPYAGKAWTGDKLGGYKPGIYWCPAVAEAWNKVASIKSLTTFWPNYGMNPAISPTGSDTIAHRQNINNPSRKVLIMDSGFNKDTTIAVLSASYYINFGTDFHNGGNNVLFVDGHVTWWKDTKSMFKQPYGNPGVFRGTMDIWYPDT
jgi:prepilin-type N-terminal cleavage/methylation domain-containing protein/prepilin-type processing-associated H-X9-DG protein